MTMTNTRLGGTLASSQKEDNNEPEQVNNHSGMGEISVSIEGGGGADGGDLVDIEKVIEKFLENTRGALRPTTQADYVSRIRCLEKEVHFSSYTKGQLRGTKGKTIIKDFIGKHPERSRGLLVAIAKRFWTSGLEIPWPLTKDELKVSLSSNPRMSPANDIIKPWVLALRDEPDIYHRLIWVMISNHGWRPSHVARLRWRNVQFDGEGEPISIYAQGTREGFKTSSPIMAWLCPEVRELLKQWRAITPYKGPEDYIIPWRKYDKIKDEPLDDMRIRLVFSELRKKYKLPKITPKDLRHWTATTCRKAGLSKQASAYLMGPIPVF